MRKDIVSSMIYSIARILTFHILSFPHRLPAHIKICSEETRDAQKDESALKAIVEKAKTKPIKTIIACRKCGKMFSAKSLSMHEDQCNSSGDAEPVVIDPEWESHLETLKACKKCKRKFFLERLEVHEPNCKADPLTT